MIKETKRATAQPLTRGELLAQASQRLGFEVTVNRLRNALRSGHIPKPPMGADGWANYTPDHVAALVDYCKTRARRYRAQQQGAKQ